MPYLLSPPVTTRRQGVWGEGPTYERSNLYRIDDPGPPPVHYDQHLVRPHSITHAEAPAHVVAGGATLDVSFSDPSPFWGPALVVRLPARDADTADSGGEAVHEVTPRELAPHLEGHDDVAKVLLTVEDAPVDGDGHHAVDHVMVLSEAAARMLVDRPRFDLFGTSWRSSDHQPGSDRRPVHRVLFERAVILEYLDLRAVPAGRFFLSAFPVRLAGATEAPVTPVLFTAAELSGLGGADPGPRSG